jgi:hypothetical protein
MKVRWKLEALEAWTSIYFAWSKVVEASFTPTLQISLPLPAHR